MITLYRTDDCRECDEIEHSLDEMTLAHKVVRLPDDRQLRRKVLRGAAPPVLLDDGESFAGIAEVRRHLEELQAFKRDWEKFQSDACYCDDEGNVI